MRCPTGDFPSRFLELLVQERTDIIEKREKDAEVEICILKNDSLDRVNEQLSKLQVPRKYLYLVSI